MRDPDLVQRAERAANALERAWGHWRVMHGLDTDPLPPVSSYVGYSLEEPWGQPRVVFGVGAEEAERLAALLAGHDCVGPVHAELTARPDWRLAASGGPATGQGRPFEGTVSVPVQAPPPGAEPVAEQDAGYVAAMSDRARADSAEADIAEAGADAEDADGEDSDAEAGDAEADAVGAAASEAELTAVDGVLSAGDHQDRAAADSRAAPIPAEPSSVRPIVDVPGPDVPGPDVLGPDVLGPDVLDEPVVAVPRVAAVPLQPLPEPADAGQPDAGEPDGLDPDVGDPEPGSGSSQHGEPAGPVQLAAVEQPGVVAFRRRGEKPPRQLDEPAQFAAAPTSDSYDAAPAQGPGYRGPRYQGVPPHYQAGPVPQERPELFGPRPEDADTPSGAGQPGASPSRVGRSGGGEPRARQSSGGQSGGGQRRTRQSGDGQPSGRQPSRARAGEDQPGSGQTQQASRHSRQGRATGGETGKRPRG